MSSSKRPSFGVRVAEKTTIVGLIFGILAVFCQFFSPWPIVDRGMLSLEFLALCVLVPSMIITLSNSKSRTYRFFAWCALGWAVFLLATFASLVLYAILHERIHSG